MRQAGATLHRGARASHYRGLSLRSTGSRRACSVVVAHGPSCLAACGIFPDQGSNPCPLHWQADSQPLRHQGSPKIFKFGFLGRPLCQCSLMVSQLLDGGCTQLLCVSENSVLCQWICVWVGEHKVPAVFKLAPALLSTEPF